ncbi:MAG TPA: tautomerase family protein [Methylovirgula sp.]|jgi:phenylpyruvate tautomerase PptA (4-oxalocrotonate tautomerase family)
MPLVRIDIPAGKPDSYRKAVSETVHAAMTETINVPKDDRFQIIAEHKSGDLVVDPTYLGITRSAEAVVIQITLNEGRTTDMKKAFFKALADGLNKNAGIRREDVVVGLVEVKKENWSFGNGIAQYA